MIDNAGSAFSFKPKFVPVVEAAQKGSQPLALR